MTYYNEIDPFAAAWLRELIKARHLPEGYVDERSIVDVDPNDLDGFNHCHFFAGIGGWAYALQLAGWPEDREVWTGSCPCQPWSIANVADDSAKGFHDERHLSPVFVNLIRQRKPSVLFGEQVTHAIRKGWLDALFSDLQAEDYACGMAVLPANCFEAVHERKRIYFVADTRRTGRQGYQQVNGLSRSTASSLPVYGDPLADARHALAGHHSDLLPCDGLSVQMERHAIKGYGNAIVPQVAQAFIEAYMSIGR